LLRLSADNHLGGERAAIGGVGRRLRPAGSVKPMLTCAAMKAATNTRAELALVSIVASSIID